MATNRSELSDLPLFAAENRPFLTITELTEAIKGALEAQLEPVWVLGEISNFRVPPSGHFYFTLKDDKSQIAAVMFRRQGAGVSFSPENGMEVLCFGRVSLYSVRGDLQFYVETIEPKGQGALYLAFEQLKKKLAREGLFDQQRKRTLPFLPVSIGIVTSDKGAALQDMLRVMGDRFPERRIVIRPVKVQGEGAAREIAAGLRELARYGGVDVIILARGGGSLEDLWAFNEEIVARAIFASPIPIISAIGHEIDFTIADFVADRRAPTPTAAAEMVVPRKAELVERLETFENALIAAMLAPLETAQERWRALVKRLTDPGRKLRDNQQRLDELSVNLLRRGQDRLRQLRHQLGRATGRLEALSPLAVLDRGYSIAHKLPEEIIVKDSAILKIGDRLRITFAKGKSVCEVKERK